jgi:hypothetical protein
MKLLQEEKVLKIDQTISEVENEGLMALLGKTVTLFCANYIYAGKLVGVNKSCVKLENAHIVYETGTFTDPKFKDAQRIAKDWYVQTAAIESFGEGKSL